MSTRSVFTMLKFFLFAFFLFLPLATLEVEAQQAAITVAPTSALSFPAVNISPIAGNTQQVLLQINQALTISSIAVQPALGGVAEYTIGTLQGCTADGTTQQAADTTCTVPVTFSPKYPGSRLTPLQVTTSAGSFFFPLSGTGLASQVSITPGTITTFAGNGTAGYTGDGGQATSAELSGPEATTVDAEGNLYIANGAAPSVRKVDAATGVITTVAGNGVAGYAPDGSAAASVSIRPPMDIVVDGAGNLYFAELDTSSIRKVDAATGILTTYAGINRSPGYTGDGGPATSAQITYPASIAMDRAGNLYIADFTNNAVRKVDAATGIISTVAGNGTKGYSGDNGPATSASLADPLDVTVDDSGNLYIADTDNRAIRKVDTNGVITTVAGTAGVTGNHNSNGPALGTSFNLPNGLAVDAAGDVYIADAGTANILKLDANQNVTIIAGSGVPGYSGDGGPATSAKWAGNNAFSTGISLDATGNLFIPDHQNAVVRKVTATAAALTFPNTTTGSTSAPQSLTISNTGNTVLTFGSITATANFTVDSGSPCLAVTTLNPGQTCALNVEFTPQAVGPLTGTLTITDDALNPTGNLVSTQQIPLSGNANGPTTITLSASAASITSTQSVTLTAKVASAATGTPTGSVVFKDGTTTLSTVTLDASATATYSTSTLAVGTHSITASYGGDTNFTGSQSASVSVTVAAPPSPDFTVAAAPAALTLKQGQTGQTTFTLTPTNGFTGTISLTCTGLPAGSTCTFNPASITADGSNKAVISTLSITTTGTNTGTITSSLRRESPSDPIPAGLFFLPSTLLAALLWIQRKKLSSNAIQLLMLLVLASGALAIAGCSGGSSPQTPPTTPTQPTTPTPTPTGSYQVSIVAASSGTAGTSHNTAFALTVTQ
jgi:sugar lactone lactonase YvrE